MGTRAHHAMTRHPLHLAVVLFLQPRLQPGFFKAEIGIANTDLLEAEFAPPEFNLLSKLLKIERV